MRNIRVRIAYDGSQFFGWQRQAGFLSVQEVLEEALEVLSGHRVVVFGSGRTDTGVHAMGQVASFHSETRLRDDRLPFALNAHLPPGVVVLEAETCPEDFHAQHSARGKRYAYLVRTTRFRPPMGEAYMHWVPDRLDLDRVRQGAGWLLGTHDFSSFANAGSPRKSNVRTLQAIHVVARRDAFALVLQGDGFLYNMVRTLAGTLLEVGRGRMEPDAVQDVLAARRRSLAGPTAPAAGLYLRRVLYPEPCFQGTGVRRAGFFG